MSGNVNKPLGVYGREQLVKKFLKTMKLDLISEVINLSYGFHSLKSTDAILWTQNCAKRDITK